MKKNTHTTPTALRLYSSTASIKRLTALRLYGSTAGQTLMELLLALGLFAFIMTAVFALVFGGLTTGLRTEEQDYATMYAQEGLDAARSIRDTNWDSFAFTSTPLAIGKTHGVDLDTTNGGWKWKTPLDQNTSDENSYGVRKYTREITVENVYRDGNNNIFTGSTSANFDYANSADYLCEGGSCPSTNVQIANGTAKLRGSVRLDNSVVPKELIADPIYTKALYHFNKSEGDELDIGVSGNLTDDDLGGASETNLKALWHLNEGSGTTAPDSSSGNLNSGALNNAALNSGFETFTGTKDDATNDTFTNWTGNLATALAVSGAYEGTTAVKLKYSGSGDNYMVSDFISPSGGVAGKTYQLTFWAKATAATSVSSIALQSYGPDWTGSEYLGPGNISLTTSWQKFTYTATFTNARNSYRVVLRTSGNTGVDVFYDKVSVGGPVWITAGKFSNALSFDGVDDYVSAAASAGSLDIDANPVTVEAWIYPTAYPASTAYKEIVGRGVHGVNGYGLALYGNTGQINVGHHGGSNFNSNTTVPLNQWSHIVGVIDGANSKIYINGAQDSATGTINIVASSDNASIGAAITTSPSTYSNYFSGSIDEAAVYNAALTPEQITDHYRRGVAEDATNPASAFEANDGNTYGPVTTAGNTNLHEALQFDGVDDYVSIPDSASFNMGSYALEAWIKSSSAASQQRIVSHQDATQYWVMGLDAGRLRFCDNFELNCAFTTETVNDGAWHHVAVVRDIAISDKYKWYIDGVLKKTVTGTNTSVHNIAQVVNIGRYNDGTQSFSGSLDEVAIWNKALSQQDIWDHIGANLGYATNTYATVKRSANFPATDYIDKFKEFVETATIPAGTTIDYQLSTDNCATMKYWDGTQWTNAGGWNDVRTINRYFDQFKPLSSTICLAARLNTTDQTQTPILDNVEIKYTTNKDNGITWPADEHTKKVTSRVKWPSGFSFQDVSLTEYLTDWMYQEVTHGTQTDFSAVEGSTVGLTLLNGTIYLSNTPSGPITYTHAAIDLGNKSKILKLLWEATVPSGTLTLQIRSADSQANLATAAWCGQTACNGADAYPITGNGNNSGISAADNQWIQYRLNFTSTVANETPVLDKITIKAKNLY